jgi:tripartite-type tricarboxylate transporter receptor subunit TctC
MIKNLLKFHVLAFFLVCLVACESEVEPQVATQVAAEVAPDPVHIISSFPETGSSARTIRILAPSIEAYFQRPVEIHYNQGGKGGDIGARMAASAPADQLTIFVGTVGNIALLPNILSSYEIEPLRDFQAVTHLTVTPDVLIVNASLGVTTLDELVAYAKASDEPLTYSHIAPLSIHRMEFLEVLNTLGIEATNDESIRGSVKAMQAVANGTVDLVMTTAPYVAPMVADGSVVPLAVANHARLPAFPDVPTMQESGIAIDHGSWSGALVPAATSAKDREQVFLALQRALTDEGVVAQLAELGMIAAPSDSPQEFADYIAAETARLGIVARAYGVQED